MIEDFHYGMCSFMVKNCISAALSGHRWFHLQRRQPDGKVFLRRWQRKGCQHYALEASQLPNRGLVNISQTTMFKYVGKRWCQGRVLQLTWALE